MQKDQRVDVFWDFETARVPSRVSGYQVAERLRDIANSYGLARSLRVYLDVTNQSHPNFSTLRTELHSSGISIIDCPSSSKRDAADKAMIVDMLILAMDENRPHTIIIATGDNGLAYALAILRLRMVKVILVYPSGSKESLLMQSDERINWHSRVLGIDSEGEGDEHDYPPSPSPSSSSSPSSSNRSLGSYISYATPPPMKSRHPSAPLTEDIHLHESVPQLSLQSSSSRPWISGSGQSHAVPPLQSPPASAAPTSPTRPRAPIPIGSPREANSSFTGASRGASAVANPKPRARSSTISAGWFFPPPPSFPLDPPPTNILTPHPGEDLETTAASPPSSGGFAIIDHPTPEPSINDTPGAIIPVTSLPAQVVPIPSEPVDVPSSVASHPTQVTPVPFEPVNVPSLVASQAASAAAPPIATNPSGSSVTTTTIPVPAISNDPKSTEVDSPRIPVLSAIPHPGTPPVANLPQTTPKGGSDREPITSTTTSAKDGPTKPQTGTKPQTVKKPQTVAKPTKKAAVIPPKPSLPSRSPPEIYRPLIKRLQVHRRGGLIWLNQSQIANEVLKVNPQTYKAAGVTRWGKYVLKAVKDGIVLMEEDSISLREEWVNAFVP